MWDTEHDDCPCGGRYAATASTVVMTVKGQELTLAPVPVNKCPVCTSQTYRPSVLARLEAAFHMRGPASAAPPEAASTEA
jgi:hypothetical protein